MSENPTAIVVATHSTLGEARSTVRSVLAAGLRCRVADIDGTYVSVGSEQVTLFPALAQRTGVGAAARLAAATLEPDELTFFAGVVAAAASIDEGADEVLLVAAGVVLLGDAAPFVAAADGNIAVIPRVASTDLGRAGLAHALVTHAVEFGPVDEPRPSTTLFTRSLVAFGRSARMDVLQQLSADWRFARGALDAYATTAGGRVVLDEATLLSPWRGIGDAAIERLADGDLLFDGKPVTAIDLSKFDPARPWILEPVEIVRPSLLISAHPILRDVVMQVAEERLADSSPATEPPAGAVPTQLFDRVLRQEARRANLMNGEIPDLLGIDGAAATVADVEDWALALVPAAHPRPVARYLVGARAMRRDLQDAFPHVPGNDSDKLGDWAIRWGVLAKKLDVDLMRRAGEATLAAQPTAAKKGRRPEGVNLVGYLSAELGLGQSARLVDQALHAAGIPTSTFDVSRRLLHRQSADYRVSEPTLFDTTLLCVNGIETGEVVKQVGDVVRGTRRVGMWYWELEEFPSTHANGFRFVDEVWAATDFIRDAIAAKSSDVAVRTVLPPLPQREGDAPALPSRFGIDPARPFFLFTFDFMSYAGRKNPLGLVEAFLEAFPEETPAGPQLVIKTVNGDKKATDAEQLRLQMASRNDLILIEEYLPNHERHVLVAHCTAYVSLHKAEGLGLTLAEAMAWGKPVIATRYGGVVQFMNDENSFLVGWTPGVIPEDMGPYNKGLAWAEPDLHEAARLMRLVVEQPERAAAVGERAAHDIRELHNVEVAGTRMRHALEQGHAEWKAARAAKRAAKAAARAVPAPPAALAAVSPQGRPMMRRVWARVRRTLRRIGSREETRR